MFTNSLKSSWSPYRGRSAQCRCSWPKPGSTVSLPPVNKWTVSWLSFIRFWPLKFDLRYLPPCRRSWQWCWWGREWAVLEGCPSSSSRRSRGRPPWGSPPCLDASLRYVSSWSWFHAKWEDLSTFEQPNIILPGAVAGDDDVDVRQINLLRRHVPQLFLERETDLLKS